MLMEKQQVSEKSREFSMVLAESQAIENRVVKKTLRDDGGKKGNVPREP